MSESVRRSSQRFLFRQVNARIGVVESAQNKSPGHQKIHELEMRVASLESKRLGQGQDTVFRDALSQNHEMKASATGAELTKCTDSETRINQQGGQVQLLQDPTARNVEYVDKVGVPTGCDGTHQQPAEQGACGEYQDADRTKTPPPLVCDDVQTSQQRLQVSHDIGDSLKFIGRLEKSISSLNRQHTGLSGETWSLKETVQKLQAHVQDLSDKYDATQQSLSKLQQISDSLSTSLQRENATQERLLEAEASQKQVLEAAAESQKIVLSLTRRVGAVEVTHMNAERAAVVAAAETRQLREQMMLLGDMLGSSGSGSKENLSEHQERPGLGSQVRSKSIDSALSHHGTAQDSCFSAMRSEVRSRPGVGRCFLNWPWKP